MLKSKVGYSTEENSFNSGIETAKKATTGKEKIGFLYTSSESNTKDIVKGIRTITDVPLIGCTSNGAIIVPDGIITSKYGFSGMLTMESDDLKIGLASHEAGSNARLIGRQVAIDAIINANMTIVPTYFYMVASGGEEEEYLMGIQDVIGRIPMFGGSASDNTIEGKWKIICNDKVFNNGVAVCFFYTKNDIVTEYTGAYRKTNIKGIVTRIEQNRTLVTIDNESSLSKYSKWIKKDEEDLRGMNLLRTSVFHPLGISDLTGNLLVVRHPMIGNTNNTMNIGNKLVEDTAIILLETTEDEIVNAPRETLKKVRENLTTKPAAYLLVHNGARKSVIEDRLQEVYNQLLKEANEVPFICFFTLSEYGYHENSANICGSLMLSFTGFGVE